MVPSINPSIEKTSSPLAVDSLSTGLVGNNIASVKQRKTALHSTSKLVPHDSKTVGRREIEAPSNSKSDSVKLSHGVVTQNETKSPSVPSKVNLLKRTLVRTSSASALTPARSAAIRRLRSQYDLNSITSKPQPYFHLLKECHHCYFHGRTRQGVHICYVRPGTTNIHRLKGHGVTAEVLTQHYLFLCEYLWSIIEGECPDAKCFVLLDLAGLKYTDIVGSSMKSMRALITLLSSVYPDRLDGLVLFNVPWFFNSLWQSVGSVVGPKTRRKMILLGQISEKSTEMDVKGSVSSNVGKTGTRAVNFSSNDPEVVDKLLEFIPPEYLPEAYFHDERCTGSADFGQSEEEMSIRRHVENTLIDTRTTAIGVDLAKYCLQKNKL
jgi:hypothetical protein